MLNVGLCAELAKQASTFHIACIDPAWTLEQAENQTYDSAHDIKVEDLSSFLKSDDLLSNPTGYTLEIANQGNITGTGFDGSNADDNQFGLWLKFNEGYLEAYMTKIFGLNSPSTQSPTINGSTLKCRWFKVWFTFIPQDKYIGSDSNGNDVFINYTKDSDRTFCFEPWIKQSGNNFNPLFCEIAAPMLNVGTTPLKFSSQEKSNEVYSEIAQTKESIEIKVNNAVNKLTKELNNVGIKLDGENSSINFNAKNSTFTGNVVAKQLSVQPEGMNSKIWLEIYNPSGSNISAAIKNTLDKNKNNNLKEGTPILIAYADGDYYVTNLTKLDFTPASVIYWGIYGKAITSNLTIYKGNSNNTINSFSDDSQIITKFNKNGDTNYGTIEIYKNEYKYGELLSSTRFITYKLTNINCDTYYTKYNNNGLIPSVTAGGSRINLNEPTPDIELKMLDDKEPIYMNDTGSKASINIFTNNGLIFVEDGPTNDFYDQTSTDNFILVPIKNIYTFRVYPKIDNGKLYDFELPMYCFAQKSEDTFKIIGFNETAYKNYISDYEKINAALVSYHGITQEVKKMFGEAIENYKNALNYGTSIYVTINNKPAINGSGVANYYNAENGRKFLFMDPNSGISEYEKAKSAFGFINMLINNDPNYSISNNP